MKQKFLFLILLAFSSVKMQAQCSASFVINQAPSGVYTFTATGTNPLSTIYSWTLGNGIAATGSSVTAAYNSPGVYTVCLTVTDTFGGCTVTSCDSVVYTGGTGSNCMADYTYICNVNGTASLTSTSTGSNISNYTWSDASGVFATGPNATYTNVPGTYSVCLKIEDTVNNCVDSICYQINLTNTTNPCQAGFYIYPDSNGAPHTYIGVNTSTGGNSYTWLWGDGTSSTGQFPSHTYANAGNYTICLVIGNPATNCIDSFCLAATINKTEAMVTINFQAPAAVGDVSNSVASIYPNPTNDYLIVKGVQAEALQVEIYTLSGSKLKSVSAVANQQINMKDIPSNMYLLKVTNSDGISKYAKFMKQ